MKTKLVHIVLLSIWVVGCVPLADALGYIPKADFEEMVNRENHLLSEIEDLESQIKVLQEKRQELEETIQSLETRNREREASLGSKIENLSKELSQWQSLQCPDHSWEFAWTKVKGSFPFRDHDVPSFRYYVQFTQWQTEPGWINGLPATTLLWDTDDTRSMAIDTEEDCIIFNPDWFDPAP
ncbi:MAG: hypothetical protein QY306_13555 [Anaerolineales bacterium]|nr:MAG: hypothetical protein QY306_13555 [Anaerolineales bacterium]